jgi:hypothetical protein
VRRAAALCNNSAYSEKRTQVRSGYGSTLVI